ncbi:MAG: TraB/GumN family protein [Candidatus Nitronauta litoralis]|uniref:TraB/GumN family protein n=1 Tax=Candidatus Nitronauta litoralis TaxID=2705533 RepID=A0A7T0BTA5_9BACT|nr:MAG: TraB/GumN family protein [Candidatus Nitronauta litoralis]
MTTDIDESLIKTVEVNGTQITLVGTAHVSHKSVELVEAKVAEGGYDCIAVELCPPRYKNLTNNDWWKNLDIYQVLKQGRGNLLLINLAMSAYQRRLADKVGIEPGREMSRAIELAQENNLQLEVVDRDISTTLSRMYHRVTFWQKMKLVTSLIASIFVGEEVTEDQIEGLKEGDMLHSMLEEFGEVLPSVKTVLIDERDIYMVGKLAALTEGPDAPKSILAMVGAGHLPGMMKAFEAIPSTEKIETLEQKPPPGKTGYYIGWAIAIVVLSMFFVGYSRSPEMGWDLVVTWVVVNGGMSALGAAIALAHPLTILSAFVAAPITSLNPTIGAGMVVGIVESLIRKPKVSDFESIRQDVAQWSLWWKNGVIRVFLIFFLANLGSAIGTWVAGISIASKIFG